MLFFYNIAIRLYTLFVQFAALRNAKAMAWNKGRQNLIEKIQKKVVPGIRYIWFHFASLGEFEQGRPVLEKLKAQNPDSRILITFFSPSGYEIRKNYPLADHVFYLPVDTATHARDFIRLINPEFAVFTKYEYWYHYFNELHNKQIPLYVISGIFRKKQPFFKWYGSLHRQMLRCVSHFFVQNTESRELLKSIGFSNVTVSGDTRFDRVAENATNAREIELICNFSQDSLTFIGGSTWPGDEDLIATLHAVYPSWKFIIAPHEINEEKIRSLEGRFPAGKTIRFSSLQAQPILTAQLPILIIDNIGMLSSLYQYADIAYIGGGFGAGIHNTLEAAAFGVPVVFGPNFQKFQEAKDLIHAGAAFSVSDENELKQCIKTLSDEQYRQQCGKIASQYVQEHTGATGMILQHINKGLNKSNVTQSGY